MSDRVLVVATSDAAWPADLATRWAEAGDQVTLVLLAGAAAAARVGHEAGEALVAALAAGASVSAHDQALARRGIGPERSVDGVKATDLDAVADLIADGADRVVWL